MYQLVGSGYLEWLQHFNGCHMVFDSLGLFIMYSHNVLGIFQIYLPKFQPNKVIQSEYQLVPNLEVVQVLRPRIFHFYNFFYVL